jgi:hypothetical protein
MLPCAKEDSPCASTAVQDKHSENTQDEVSRDVEFVDGRTWRQAKDCKDVAAADDFRDGVHGANDDLSRNDDDSYAVSGRRADAGSQEFHVKVSINGPLPLANTSEAPHSVEALAEMSRHLSVRTATSSSPVASNCGKSEQVETEGDIAKDEIEHPLEDMLARSYTQRQQALDVHLQKGPLLNREGSGGEAAEAFAKIKWRDAPLNHRPARHVAAAKVEVDVHSKTFPAAPTRAWGEKSSTKPTSLAPTAEDCQGNSEQRPTSQSYHSI